MAFERLEELIIIRTIRLEIRAAYQSAEKMELRRSSRSQGKSTHMGTPNLSANSPSMVINLLTPNVNYSGRTAPLTSKVAFYIFIQQI